MACARVVLDEARVVVIDKPSGLTSEEVSRHFGRRLVHRIDRGTSGLLVLADDARTVTRLQRALRAGGVARAYLFVALGIVRAARLDDVLVRDGGDGRRGVAHDHAQAATGKRAITDLTPLLSSPHATLGLARLVTGRTHQVRIQLAHAGHPIIGDDIYGRARHEGRLLLHALHLAFEHPTTHQRRTITSNPPDDFVTAAASVLAVGLAAAPRPTSGGTVSPRPAGCAPAAPETD